MAGNTLSKRDRAGVTAVLVGSMILSGCGKGPETTAASTGLASESSTALATSATFETVELVFDGLDGGSSIIMVYPGVQDTPQDTIHNGTFPSGESVTALCATDGRQVSSDPSLGELARTSDKWIQIEGSPGETQYATAVYTKNPEELVAELPPC